WRKAFKDHMTESAYLAYAPYLSEIESFTPDYKRFENLRVYPQVPGVAGSAHVFASYMLDLRHGGGMDVLLDVMLRFALIESGDGTYRIAEMEVLSPEEMVAV